MLSPLTDDKYDILDNDMPAPSPSEHISDVQPNLTTPEQIVSALESVLFIAGRPMDINDLRKLLGLNDDELREGLSLLAEVCERERRGVRVQRLGDQVQLVSAPENARFVASLLGMPTQTKLTAAAMETLAIIAFRQPITRGQIEAIRGVNSDRALATLTQHGMVMEVGRASSVGRPVLFGTTLEFLQQFGLSSLDALPPPELNDELEQRRARDANAVRRAVNSGDPDQMKLPLDITTTRE